MKLPDYDIDELERWDLERVVEMTADYMRRKEDAEFEKAFTVRGL